MSKTDAVKSLARAARMSETQLKAFRQLDEATLIALVGKIDHAYRKQEHALTAALEGTLAHLPLLLRAPVRRIFGG